MMTDNGEDVRLIKIAYLYMSEHRDLAEVRNILRDRGATDLQADEAIRSAGFQLREVAKFRNFQMLKTAIAGVCVVGLGIALISASQGAALRFQGMLYTIIALGFAVLVYSAWSRAQRF